MSKRRKASVSVFVFSVVFLILLVSTLLPKPVFEVPSVKATSTYTLLPNAAGDKAENTPSAGANYQCCDETPHDSDTSYVKSSTTDDLGQTDLYNIQPATGTIPVTETITNVAVTITSRGTSATYKASHCTKIKTGGTEYTGVSNTPGLTYTAYTTNYALNPKTGLAWTLSDLDALQAGTYIESIYREATETYYVGRCTQCKITVTTTPANTAPTNDARAKTDPFTIGSYGWVNITVSDIDLVANLKTVDIKIDTSGDVQTFTLRWTQATNVFSEASDTSGICTLDTGTSIRVNIDVDTDRINFYFKFTSGATTGLCDITATTTDDSDATDVDTWNDDFTLNAAGYALNLCVKDWDLTDAISGATVYKDTDTLTSNGDGWANWTLVTGTVAIKVKYFGFWVNGTFNVVMSSDQTINIKCKLYDVTVTEQESVQTALLSGANITVFNATSTFANRIKSGVTNGNGQVVLTNLPNNTLTFTQYAGSSFTIVIGNTTQAITTENQSFTLTASQNYVGVTSPYNLIVIVTGLIIPLKELPKSSNSKRKRKNKMDKVVIA